MSQSHSLAFALGRFAQRLRPAPLGVLFKRLVCLRRVELASAEGVFWVDPGSDIGQRLYQSGAYDPAAAALLHAHLRPGDTYVDIGANEGHLCVTASRIVGPGGRVLAVEPQSRLQAVLRRNLSLNGCTAEIISMAVSDQAGEATFHLAPDTNNASSGLANQTRYAVPTERVHLTTLARLLEDHQATRPALLKMDIEGFEHEAILGSAELFQNHRIPLLMLELHERALAHRGLDPRAVPDFLAACGYRQLPESAGLIWAAPSVT